MDSECDLLTDYEYEYDRSPADYEVQSSGMSSGSRYESPSSTVSSGDSDDTTSETEDEKVVAPFTLCLENSVTRLTKLSSKARAFEPPVPRDMYNVLAVVHHSMCLGSYRKIINVQMVEGKLGGTTTIIASCRKRSLRSRDSVKMLDYVKKTLLDAASKSQSTYVMGYTEKPFTSIGKMGFSAKLSSVPAEHRETTCWDTYRKGYCPRRATCRWCHPADNDVMTVVVMLMDAGGGYSQR